MPSNSHYKMSGYRAKNSDIISSRKRSALTVGNVSEMIEKSAKKLTISLHHSKIGSLTAKLTNMISGLNYLYFISALVALLIAFKLYEHKQASVILCFVVMGVAYALTKNMSIVLTVAFIITILGSHFLGKKEGLDNMDATTSPQPDAPSAVSTAMKPLLTAVKNKLASKEKVPSATMSSSTTATATTVTPSENSTPDEEAFNVGPSAGKKYEVDYASTVEEAYSNLNKVLGSDGIKKLTTDTQSLVNQQMQLAEAMKGMQPMISGMAPLMKQAQSLLQGFGSGNDSIAQLAKQFTKK